MPTVADRISAITQSAQNSTQEGAQSGLEAFLKGNQMRQQAQLQGQSAQEAQERGNEQLRQMFGGKNTQEATHNALKGGAGFDMNAQGGVSVTKPANLAGALAGQSKNLVKMVNDSYKPVNDGLNAAQATIDYLEPDKDGKVSNVGFKNAVMNEVKTSLGSGRGVPSIIQGMGISNDIASDATKLKNYLDSSGDSVVSQQNINNLRNATFDRAQGLASQHQDLQDQWNTQGHNVAPMADVPSIVGAAGQRAGRTLDYLGKAAKNHGYGARNAAAAPTQTGAAGPAGAYPRTVTHANGSTATVSNDQEAQEAAQMGYK